MSKKYYYNGVLLPDFPKDVIADYPYQFIRKNTGSGYYDLILCKGKFYYSSSMMYISGSDARKFYRVSISDSDITDEWNYYKDSTGTFMISTNKTLFWSSIDVPNGSATSTTIYFRGSEPVPQIEKKYLIRDGETYYNVLDGALNEITVTDLTAQVCEDSGIDDIPSGDLIKTLKKPEVLVWTNDADANISARATVSATPFPQTIERIISLNHESITGIENATATVVGNPVFSCSFDGGVTYEAHNGTDWVTVDSGGGMSKEQLESITTDKWNDKVNGLIEFAFRITLNSVEDSVTQIKINFSN